MKRMKRNDQHHKLSHHFQMVEDHAPTANCPLGRKCMMKRPRPTKARVPVHAQHQGNLKIVKTPPKLKTLQLNSTVVAILKEP
jgi:hypothetical protein